MLPKGLDFTNDQLEQIDDILTQLYWDTEAQSILLADITGQLISVLGESNINTSVLSALAAGNLAATKEMARLVGEPARFKLLLHEGEQRSVYLSDVDDELVIVAIFSQHTRIGDVTEGSPAELAGIGVIIRADQGLAGNAGLCGQRRGWRG